MTAANDRSTVALDRGCVTRKVLVRDFWWSSVIGPLLDGGQPQTILVVGLDHGPLADRLVDHVADDGALHAIPSHAEFEPGEQLLSIGKRFTLHEGPAHEEIEAVADVDLAILAGDPNWYSAFHQLRALERRSLEDGHPFPVVIVHNVRWPYGRRDMYSDPERIPEEFRQPWERRGVVPGSTKLVPDGMFAERNHAVLEHGPRNGVRTAVDDFIADSYRRWRFADLPGLDGIGVLVSSDRLEARPELEHALERFAGAEFLSGHVREVELARVASAAESQRARAEVTELASRSDEFESELRSRVREHERLLAEHDTLQARLDELERLHRESEAEHGRLAQQLAEMERASQAVLGEQAALAARAHEVEAMLAERERELATAAGTAEETKARLAAVEGELEESLAELADVESRALGLEEARRDAERTAEWLRREAQRAQAGFEAELGAAERRVASLEAERDRLRDARDADRERSTQRISELERALGTARSDGDSLTLERDRLQSDLAGERSARAEAEAALRQAETQLEDEREVREDALVLARRVEDTRSWQLGHGTFSLLRRLTFRRSRGTSAVTRLVNRLETPQLEQKTGAGTEVTDRGTARRDIEDRS
jgi:chromosome segregation ATPase